MTRSDTPEIRARIAAARIAAAIAAALAFAFGIYLLLEAAQPVGGLVSFTFLLVLPAAICAFAAYVADPFAERSRRAYLMVPVWLLLAVILLSFFILKEGVICILILSPLWLISGCLGTYIAYKMRHRPDDGEGGTTYCIAALLAPLMAMQIEPYIPLPETMASVSREIVVDASPTQIWPLLRGIPDVHAGEGRWNVSQDVIGIPRPIGARLVGEGVGAERLANWGRNVRFREKVIAWAPERRLEWRFIFDDIEGWRFTDRHLMPDSPYFKVTTGGYRIEPLGPHRTRVVLETRYWIQTPVNAYSQLWGQLFLGDVENNLLALVKQRAERNGYSHG